MRYSEDLLFWLAGELRYVAGQKALPEELRPIAVVALPVSTLCSLLADRLPPGDLREIEDLADAVRHAREFALGWPHLRFSRYDELGELVVYGGEPPKWAARELTSFLADAIALVCYPEEVQATVLSGAVDVPVVQLDFVQLRDQTLYVYPFRPEVGGWG